MTEEDRGLGDPLRETFAGWPTVTVALIAVLVGLAVNCVFIGTPGDHFPHRIDALGGVRLIL